MPEYLAPGVYVEQELNEWRQTGEQVEVFGLAEQPANTRCRSLYLVLPQMGERIRCSFAPRSPATGSVSMSAKRLREKDRLP